MKSVAIVQFDDRPDSEVGPMIHLVGRNAHYAQERGYTHVFIREHDNEVPVYWHKLALIEKYLEKFEFVAWLDTDAVVHDFSLSIESLFSDSQAMVFSGDPPVLRVTPLFNAGVFFCRGPQALAMIREWRALYPAHLWRKTGDQWNFKEHVWAGPAFEQGSFAEKLFPKYADSGLFNLLSWKRLQSPCPLPESLTLHFANMFRANLFLYLSMISDR